MPSVSVKSQDSLVIRWSRQDLLYSVREVTLRSGQLRACLRRGNGPGTSLTLLPSGREHGHHASTTDLPPDLTDEQWALIEPLLPPANTGGRPEKHPRRDVVDAILYVVRTGCSWRHLPVDFPPWQKRVLVLLRWEEAKVTEQVMTVLRRRVRTTQRCSGEPSAGIIDSQSTKGADTVGQGTLG